MFRCKECLAGICQSNQYKFRSSGYIAWQIELGLLSLYLLILVKSLQLIWISVIHIFSLWVSDLQTNCGGLTGLAPVAPLGRNLPTHFLSSSLFKSAYPCALVTDAVAASMSTVASLCGMSGASWWHAGTIPHVVSTFWKYFQRSLDAITTTSQYSHQWLPSS